MRVLISAVSAKMGGTANYIREIAAQVTALDAGAGFVFLVAPEQEQAVKSAVPTATVIASEIAHAPFWRRVWFDQVDLRRLTRRYKADVLFSTANFAMLAAPCRQILLVRNKLFFSKSYWEMFKKRKSFRWKLDLLLRRWLNCISIRAADIVMFPTQSMLDDVRDFVNVPPRKGIVNHYGVDHNRFPRVPISANYGSRPLTLLFPSFYCEHKGFKTLMEALVHLTTTGSNCRLITPASPGDELQRWTCTWQEDAALASDSRLAERIEFTGILNGKDMPALYGRADLVVYPCAIESFGHPLLEAMASGLPIVAADVPGNRELCGDAAIYFPANDANSMAACIQTLARDPELREELARRGLMNVRPFTWRRHVEQLFEAFYAMDPTHEAAGRTTQLPSEVI